MRSRQCGVRERCQGEAGNVESGRLSVRSLQCGVRECCQGEAENAESGSAVKDNRKQSSDGAEMSGKIILQVFGNMHKTAIIIQIV